MSQSDQHRLGSLLEQYWPSLSLSKRSLILRYYQLVIEENARQNLTRLTSPDDFFDGHLVDVRFLVESQLINFPVMDLGTGLGVPGLVAGIVENKPWILVESEFRKAEFLKSAVATLGQTNFEVVHGRAEAYLKRKAADTIVARAVASVEKIYGWIGECSTWNKLVLLKGPRWDEEWNAFQVSRYRNKLMIGRKQDYLVGKDKKQRCLVELLRVPRGTK